MNDIDRYLDQACRQVNGPDSLRQHLRKELKEHLEEAIDALVAEGMSASDATAKAIEDLGDPDIIRDGMESVYGQGVTSLFVDRAMKWKDRRWHLAAQIGLVLIMVSAIFLFWFVPVYIVPVTQKVYQERGLELPSLMQATLHVLERFFGVFQVFGVEKHWYVLLIPPVAVVVFFEWMCKSDNKTSIRTFLLVGMSLVSVVGAFWVAGVTLVSFAMLNN